MKIKSLPNLKHWFLRRKETGVNKALAKHGSDLQHENSLPDRKIDQTYHTGEPYISNQKSSKIQGSTISTPITGTPVAGRELYRNTSALVKKNSPPAEKHIAELGSHSTIPAIKVTIGMSKSGLQHTSTCERPFQAKPCPLVK